MSKKRTSMTAGALRIKRIYDPPDDDDGLRVLVDRLWPRGLTKEKARVDLWLKDIAPSHDLRRRFHGEPNLWEQFVAAYATELEQELAKPHVDLILERLADTTVTLLYAAKNKERNNAAALRGWLAARMTSAGPTAI